MSLPGVFNGSLIMLLHKRPQISPSSSVRLKQLKVHRLILMSICSLEEFGVTTNQATIYTGWWNEIISSGLTGDLIWQAGSTLSNGNTADDGYAVYPTGTVYPIMASMAAKLKARG